MILDWSFNCDKCGKIGGFKEYGGYVSNKGKDLCNQCSIIYYKFMNRHLQELNGFWQNRKETIAESRTPKRESQQAQKFAIGSCPDCGATLWFQEGCASCQSCGFGRC